MKKGMIVINNNQQLLQHPLEPFSVRVNWMSVSVQSCPRIRETYTQTHENVLEQGK